MASSSELGTHGVKLLPGEALLKRESCALDLPQLPMSARGVIALTSYKLAFRADNQVQYFYFFIRKMEAPLRLRKRRAHRGDVGTRCEIRPLVPSSARFLAAFDPLYPFPYFECDAPLCGRT